jgi:methylmalonyl-CoA/ethylmalonyl-CoA epimerase
MSNVHHVCWCLQPEHMDGAKELWEERLHTELIDFAPPGLGIRVLINWEAGVEIICPEGEGGTVGPKAREFLERHGEGVYAVVVDVEDLDRATADVRSAGADLTDSEDIVFGEGADALRVRQMMFDELLGMRLTLQHTDPVST